MKEPTGKQIANNATYQFCRFQDKLFTEFLAWTILITSQN